MKRNILNVLTLLMLPIFIIGIAFCSESSFVVYNEAITNINETIEIHASFFNNEDRTLETFFVGDIYFGSERVDSFRVGPKEIELGEDGIFRYEFLPRNLGKYYVKSFIVYGDQFSETKDSMFTTLVNEEMVPFASGYAVIALIGIAGAVVAIKVFTDNGKEEFVGQYKNKTVHQKPKYKL